MKRFLTILTTLFISVASFAQGQLVTWSSHVEKAEGDICKVIFTGKIADGYHTYTLTDEFSATEIMDAAVEGGELVGGPYEISVPTEETDEFGDPAKHYYNEIVIAQDIKVNGENTRYTGTIFTNSCTGGACKAEYYDFDVKVGGNAVVAAATEVSEPEPVQKTAFPWGLILQAILWGFAMLLTPCVFPMVPMTVSFFLKGSGSVAQGRFKAGMYGLFIVLLYTLPIALLIVITRIIGGESVTADIFNWIATHWLPNILFFIIFMVFAASFFGAFEITLPQSLVNKSDKGSDKKGLAGVFFMALTLVLVSFSCTGPIVGNVLIQATSSNGAWWIPIVTMFAFSLAFALPFTLLAFFPSLLKDLKKSGGGWLNTVKVVMGFIEVALGFKFLSMADQTYHWGILDREVYLAIWIVVFALLGFYLLGKLKFAHDDDVPHVSVPRLSLAIVVFSFVVYMIPGMWGAPLDILSGYLPPMSSHDFVLTPGSTSHVVVTDAQSQTGEKKYDFLHLPHNLEGYFDLEDALAVAKEAGKPVFVDVTGHACVNCREMEQRVWSDPAALEILRNDFVICALYVDDKHKLPEEDWVTDAETGKVYKDLGRANSYIAREKFNVNAQPNYVLLSPDGEILVPTHSYDLSVENFIKFLKSGLEANAK
ncbi:MAG: thioredoxin family protein [Bacteroidales bacterium]|nr:thioredoxin family protein [Bacteroidales bacterium]